MNNNFNIAKSVLAEKGILTGVTTGNSMSPLFRDGKHKAKIIPINKKLKLNDVLLYKKSSTSEVILHRIIKFKNGKPVLRGDNTFYNETNIPEDNILGVMDGFYRGNKYYSCSHKGYKLYVFCIRTIYPFRRLLHKFASFIRIIKRKIKNPT